MKHSHRYSLCLLLLLNLLLGACGAGRSKADAGERPVVAVSSGPEEWLVRNIAGDRVECVTLLPPGADAEHFEPAVSTMKRLRDARIWFTFGTEGFESALASQLPSNFPDMQMVSLAEGIEPLNGTHKGGDPHLVLSLRNLRTIAHTLTDNLVRLLPDDEEQLRENNAALQLRMRELDDSISTLFGYYPLLEEEPDSSSLLPDSEQSESASTKTAGRSTAGKAPASPASPAASFVVLHPSLSYFARDYNLRQIPLERDGKEPSPSAMAAALRNAAASGAKVLILDSSHPAEGAAALARGEGLRPVTVTLGDTAILATFRQLAAAIAR